MIRGVSIPDQEFTEIDVSSVAAVKPAGIIPNYNDYGFMKSSYDQKTLDWLEENLHRIEDKACRALIWRMLWDHVKSLKMTATQYLRFISKQFVHEDVY